MAKRGERRPWRVEYAWSNGVRGVDTYTQEEDAREHADQLARNALAHRPDLTLTVNVRHRDTPA